MEGAKELVVFEDERRKRQVFVVVNDAFARGGSQRAFVDGKIGVGRFGLGYGLSGVGFGLGRVGFGLSGVGIWRRRVIVGAWCGFGAIDSSASGFDNDSIEVVVGIEQDVLRHDVARFEHGFDL